MKADRVVYMHCGKVDGVCFYIGAGSPNRPTNGPRSKAWCDSATERGGVVYHILASGLTSDEALLVERELITSFKNMERLGWVKSALVNVNNGGFGSVGRQEEVLVPEPFIGPPKPRRVMEREPHVWVGGEGYDLEAAKLARRREIAWSLASSAQIPSLRETLMSDLEREKLARRRKIAEDLIASEGGARPVENWGWRSRPRSL